VKSDNPAKHFILAFLLALVVYVIFYQGIEHRRARKGAWAVTFTTSPFESAPTIIINQARLAITNVQITFSGEILPSTNQPPITLSFSQPRAVPYDVPFGKCIFADLTFLPGTVTFSNVFGHEIELLPRVLIIDYQEYPWRSGEVLTLRRR